jgi:hypothetical protein
VTPPAPAWPAAQSGWPGQWAAYAPIRLDPMDGVTLLDRTDTKYLLTERQLAAALAAPAATRRATGATT